MRRLVAVRAHQTQPVGRRIEVEGGGGGLLPRLAELDAHGRLAGSRVDGHEVTIAGDAIQRAVGRTHVDAENRPGASDIDLRGHLAAGRIDGHDRLAVDEANDPAIRLRGGGHGGRRGEYTGQRQGLEMSNH